MSTELERPEWLSWVSGLIGGMLAFVTAWVWKVRGTIAENDRAIADVENDLADKMSAVERGFHQIVDSSMRVMQQDIFEIKDLLHKHEVFVRDTFARRESVYALSTEIKQSLDKGLDALRTDIVDLRRMMEKK